MKYLIMNVIRKKERILPLCESSGVTEAMMGAYFIEEGMCAEATAQSRGR